MKRAAVTGAAGLLSYGLSRIPLVNAVAQQGVIDVPFGKNTVTVDGKLTTPDEYADARWIDLSTKGDKFAIKHNETNLYLYFNSVFDKTFHFEKSQLHYDGVMVYFDTLNDGGKPKGDDYVFGILWKSDFGPFFGMSTGNGELYNSPFGSPIEGSEGAAANNMNREYEFKIPLSMFRSQTAGLYVIATDGNANNGVGEMLYWPSITYSPDTYGDMTLTDEPVAEFPVAPITLSLAIGLSLYGLKHLKKK